MPCHPARSNVSVDDGVRAHGARRGVPWTTPAHWARTILVVDNGMRCGQTMAAAIPPCAR
jgi:predicted phosphoribosyltransferase